MYFGSKYIGFEASEQTQPRTVLFAYLLGGQTFSDYSVLYPINTDWLGTADQNAEVYEPADWSALTNWKTQTQFPDGIGVAQLVTYRDSAFFSRSMERSLVINFSKHILPARYYAIVNSIAKIKVNEDDQGNPIYEPIYTIAVP